MIVRAARDQHAEVRGDRQVVLAAPAAGDPLPGLDRVQPRADQRREVVRTEQGLAALDLRGMRE